MMNGRYIQRIVTAAGLDADSIVLAREDEASMDIDDHEETPG